MSSRTSLSTRIILMVGCILLISSILFCSVSIYVSRSSIRKSIQQRMLDIIRERGTLLESMPSGWFIRNRMKIEYEVISSEKTQEVLRTRREDDVELFS